MTKDEALRLALEALEKVTKQMLAIRDELAERGGRPTNNFVHEELWDSSFDVYINCAIPTAETIKAALEAKDEPVETKIVTAEQHDKNLYARYKQDMKSRNWISFDNWLLETHPPQRTWAGLTSEEKIIMSRYDLEYAALIGEVERKLKEKNT